MFVTEFGGTETVQLSASASDVFDLLVDVDRLPEWNARTNADTEAFFHVLIYLRVTGKEDWMRRAQLVFEQSGAAH